MEFPPNDKCFLCNEDIDFASEYEFAVSWPSGLPRAERPTRLLWVHEQCARQAAHPTYVLDRAD